MKIATMLVAGLCAMTLAAEEVAATNAVPKRKLTPQEVAQLIRKGNLKLTGGRIRKPQSAKGCFIVVNAQKAVDPAVLQKVFAYWNRHIKIETRMVTAEKSDIVTIGGQIAAAGGKLGLALVESDELPALLSATECGWTIINVRALAADKPTPETLARRTRVEMMRALALSGGCAYMARTGIAMRDVRTLAELDALKEDYGVEVLNQLHEGLPALGITPWYEVTYKKACREGWAPMPTNEYQKVIWEKVKAEANTKPSNPMKITKEKK